MRTRSGNTLTPQPIQQKRRRKDQTSVKDTTHQQVLTATKNKPFEAKLEKLYKDVASTPSYSAKIAAFLRQNHLHSTHRRVIKQKFPRRRVISRFPFELFMADLIEYKQYKFVNRHYSYILLLIDCFTRVVYTAPMKRKDAQSTTEAFESIFSKFDQFPINLVTDDGKEFFNNQVKNLFLTYGINHYSTPTKTKMKASLAERAIRTIKSRLQKIFILNKSQRWIDVIDQVVKNYNNTPHRSIGMAPSEVNDSNRKRVYKRLYPNESISVVCKLREGDKVRKIIEKKEFEKGYTQNWSTEVFIVSSVRQSNTVCYYKIKTLNNKPVPGIFYYFQLNLVARNDTQP